MLVCSYRVSVADRGKCMQILGSDLCYAAGMNASSERPPQERAPNKPVEAAKPERLSGLARLQVLLGLHLLQALGSRVDIKPGIGANNPAQCGEGIGTWTAGADSGTNMYQSEPGESYSRSFRRFMREHPEREISAALLEDVEGQATLFKEICTFRKKYNLSVPPGFD